MCRSETAAENKKKKLSASNAPLQFFSQCQLMQESRKTIQSEV